MARRGSPTDGRSWAPLAISGDVPPAGVAQAVLLPGGALVSDGTTTWFGVAHGRWRTRRDRRPPGSSPADDHRYTARMVSPVRFPTRVSTAPA